MPELCEQGKSWGLRQTGFPAYGLHPLDRFWSSATLPSGHPWRSCNPRLPTPPGAFAERKIRSIVTHGRSCFRYSSTASPASCGSGSRTSRRPLPRTKSVASCQSISAGRMLAMSPARSPRRSSNSMMARSRDPKSPSLRHESQRRAACPESRHRGALLLSQEDTCLPTPPGRPIPLDVGHVYGDVGRHYVPGGARFRSHSILAPYPSGIAPHFTTKSCPTSNGISAPLGPEYSAASVAA